MVGDSCARTQYPVLARGCEFKSHLRYWRLEANRILACRRSFLKIQKCDGLGLTLTTAAVILERELGDGDAPEAGSRTHPLSARPGKAGSTDILRGRGVRCP